MQNLKITLHIDGGAILSNNPLDGLLAKLYFETLKERNAFSGDFAMRLPFLELDEEGFYHISAPVYSARGIEVQEFVKSFDLKAYKKAFPDAKITKQMLSAGSGRFKSFLFGYEIEFVDEVVFYARGDKEAIVSLLQNLHYIGKKTSLGYGKIKKITVSELEEDASVVQNGCLMRNVPADSRYLSRIEGEAECVVARLQHPYWERRERTLCAVSIKGDT